MHFYTRATRLARPAVCVAALLTGSAAFADVTAQQVWDDWKATMGGFGSNGVTIGSEVAEGGTVTITDFTVQGSDETGGISGTLASIVLTEQGDGTVAITMSDTWPFKLTSTMDGVETTMSMNVVQNGLTMTVSGTPEEMTYEMVAASYGVTLGEVMEAGAAVPISGSVMFNNVSGSYVSTPGDLHTVDYALISESVDVAVNVTDPETSMVVNVAGKMSEVATAAVMTIPPLDTPEDQIFEAGLAIAGGYTFGATNFTFDTVDPTAGNVSGVLTATGGSTDVSFDKDAMGYDSSISGMVVDITSQAMPFPVQMSIAEYGAGILFPLAKTDTPADWAAFVNLTDLSVNDEIWAMIDGGNVLPHDPATLIMDLSGTATMFGNFMDPEAQAAAAMGEAPGEMNSFDINDLTLRIGGAEVMATGALTLDNTDTTTIPGVPRPEGAIDITMNGVNGLMDKLVAMGLVPEDQLMMPRMMMGMFATVVGEDQLTSKIEFTPEGGIFANGQQLQ